MKAPIHVLPMAARVGVSRGHEHAANVVRSEAERRGHHHVILLGTKHDGVSAPDGQRAAGEKWKGGAKKGTNKKSTNPLPPHLKLLLHRRALGKHHNVELMHPNVVDHITRLAHKHKEVHLYASDDEEDPGKDSRSEEYKKMFRHLPNVKVHAQQRVGDGSTPFRGRHMRDAVANGDFATYKKNFASGASNATVAHTYDAVRYHSGLPKQHIGK